MMSTLLVCRSCPAGHVVELNSEVCMHSPGLKGLDVEPIFVFPKLKVCLRCGSIQFGLSATELHRVREVAAEFEAVSEARQ